VRVRTEERREAILKKASEVFIAMGYERASMAEIASRAGCSKPTLYGYFPSKADLFLEVLISRLGEGAKSAFLELPSLTQVDPETVLANLGEQYIKSITHPEATGFRRLIASTMTNEADAQHFWEIGNKQAVIILGNYLKAATEAGRLRVTDSWVAAQQLFSLYEAEINWGGPIGISRTWTAEMIKQASARAVKVFLAAYEEKQ